MYSLIHKQEKGISLIETIVSLAIISIISVVFMTGLATNIKGQVVQDEGAVSEAIVVGQIEYIKTQPFSTNEWSYTISTSSRNSTQQPSWWDDDNPPLLENDYTEYYIVVTAEDFDADGDNLLEIPGDDDSVRKITTSVYNNQNELLLALTVIKSNR